MKFDTFEKSSNIETENHQQKSDFGHPYFTSHTKKSFEKDYKRHLIVVRLIWPDRVL